MGHHCYVLENDQGCTYIGYSVDLCRRLRQHNGQIKGGARSTCGKGPWRFLYFVSSPQLDRHSGLSLEWHLKRPLGCRSRQFWGVEGRLKALPLALSNPKFEGMEFTVSAGVHLERVRALCAGLGSVEVVAVESS